MSHELNEFNSFNSFNSWLILHPPLPGFFASELRICPCDNERPTTAWSAPNAQVSLAGYPLVSKSKPSYRFQRIALLTMLNRGSNALSKRPFRHSLPGLDCFDHPGQLFCCPAYRPGSNRDGCDYTGRCLRPSTFRDIGSNRPGTPYPPFEHAEDSHIRFACLGDGFACPGAVPGYNLPANTRCNPSTCL